MASLRKPSELLSNPEWIAAVYTCFATSSLLIRRDIDETMKKKGDELVSILVLRLDKHVKERIKYKVKYTHWCIVWCRTNLPVGIALMLPFGQFKVDMSCLDESSCLLPPPSNLSDSSTLLPPSSNFLLVKHSVQNLQGAYLYFDKNNSEYIRSGKVTGRGFKVRHDEHARKAQANRLLSDGSAFIHGTHQ